ncbi:granzyme A-like [Glossophaga mutica]
MALIEGSQLCAGALVRASWVLTAAHCALKGKPRVILGAHKEKYVQAFPIKKAVSYPCFDPVSFEGDLQLLQLEGKATTTKAVKILEPPKSGEDIEPRTACRVAGWGRTGGNSCARSRRLMEASVTVIDRRVCNKAARDDLSPVVDRGMICGDSGSPLIREGVFRGVTSFGKRGDSRKPGVYILLTKKYLNWGRKTIAGAIGPPCLEAGS